MNRIHPRPRYENDFALSMQVILDPDDDVRLDYLDCIEVFLLVNESFNRLVYQLNFDVFLFNHRYIAQISDFF